MKNEWGLLFEKRIRNACLSAIQTHNSGTLNFQRTPIKKHFKYSQVILYQRLAHKTVEKWQRRFWKNGKDEYLTFLTFINGMRIQQASANLQQVIEELLNWS